MWTPVPVPANGVPSGVIVSGVPADVPANGVPSGVIVGGVPAEVPASGVLVCIGPASGARHPATIRVRAHQRNSARNTAVNSLDHDC